jgi:Zn-dependent alcohol dehydrogenase
MKAAVCYEFGKPLVVEEVALDPPKAGEVKVKLAACAICHSDIHYAEGAWGGRLPAIYGHEAAGVVEEAGPGVSLTAPGDHVVVTLIRSCGDCFFCTQGEPHMCETLFRLDKNDCHHDKNGGRIKQGLRTGAFAEYVVVEESQVVPIPKEVPLDSASLLACGVITGLGAVVNTAKVPAGSSVVVIGTGGVGLNSVQGAALSGAQPIIALDLSDAKLEAAKTFGATDAVNPAVDDAKEAVKGLTNGRGADFVFVTVGSVKAIEEGLGLLRNAGTLVVVGMPAAGRGWSPITSKGG